MQVFGIDVSHWQGNFNFKQAKAEGVNFAIIKAGGGDDGLYTDSKFSTYYNNAKAAGLGVGAYFFGQAMTVAQAQKEADKFLSILKGKQFDYPVYYDVEAKMLQLGKKTLTDVVIAFCERVEKAGYYVGIYSGAYTFNNNMDDARLARYAHWAAYWGTKKPSLAKSDLGIWQFGGETNFIRSNKIAGVVCDQNYCYVDYPEAIIRLGLNGYPKQAATTEDKTQEKPQETPKPTPKPQETPKEEPKKSNDEIADEVIAGKWGIAPERKKNLEAAGYNYQAVQNIVNKKMKAFTTTGERIHTVNRGETLSGIAKKYGTTVAKIVALNNIKNPNVIYAGQKLRIK